MDSPRSEAAGKRTASRPRLAAATLATEVIEDSFSALVEIVAAASRGRLAVRCFRGDELC